jgi:cytochrome c-type biogenesis protein CcmH/NrfF
MYRATRRPALHIPVRSQPDPVFVAGAETPPVARAIITTAMSPYCPGLTLEVCPSPQADSLRQVIIARVQRGDTRAVIEADLERDFGSEIRSMPKAEGFGLIGWAVPGLMILGGVLFVTRWLRRQVRR